MDSLSIFGNPTTEVSFKSEDNNTTIDSVIDALGDVEKELLLTRKGNEVFVYGEEVEDSDEVDLDDVEPKVEEE